MTGLQELHDEILGLEAQLHGKRLELAMAKGEREEAQGHLRAMNHAIQERRAFRINCGTDGGGCYFTAAGHAGQVRGGVANA